jgi:tetratricopeptide (TPR) repeat protein
MSKRRSHTPARPGPASRALEGAIFALQMQRPYEAEHIAADVLKTNRNDARAAQVLGQALLMQNRAGEAIAPLERAVLRSEDPAAETLLAMALAASGQREKALEQLRRTTSRRPPYPQAFLEQGGLLAKLARFDDAIAILESGIALAPGALELRIELGFVHLKRNDRAKARAMWSEVLATAPERRDARVALAKGMVLDGEYAAAADILRYTLGLRPDDAMSRNNLGACLLELGQRDAGEASIRAAASGAPQMTGLAITSLASASHGRFFLRPSAAAKFLRAEKKT